MTSGSTNRKVVIIAVVALVLVLGVGAATYLLGSNRDQEATSAQDYVALDLGTVKGFDGTASEALFLPWGNGPADASRKGDPVPRSTIEAVFSSGGRIFVVDHPEGVFGARVRWFSPKGELLGSQVAPGGSTLFRPYDDGGYMYVVAKGSGASERAVLCDVDASTEVTYTIPLGLNSGGLVFHRDMLYAIVNPTEADLKNQVVYSRHSLVRVAASGEQVDDSVAQGTMADGWGWGFDGKPYTARTQVQGLDPVQSEMLVLVGSGKAKLRIPRRYQVLGVSSDSTIWLKRMPPEPEATYARETQLSSAWISNDEPYVDVLLAKMDGTVDSCITLPWSRAVALDDTTLPLWLSDDGLYTIRETEGGVAVVAYRAK